MARTERGVFGNKRQGNHKAFKLLYDTMLPSDTD